MPASKRLILITGVTRGLGRAMAGQFSARGHTVVGCGRSAQHVAELQKEHGKPHDFTAVNVASDEQVAAWAKRVLAQHGPPDLLLNNAALMNRTAPLWELPADEFDPVIDVNIKGVVNVIRHFGPAMVKRRAGVIVNFSSGWGRSTAAEVAPYCATKYAVEGLSKAMAQEVPAGMAVIPLNPGVIDTDMLRSCWGDTAASYPDPFAWAEKVVPFLLQLGPQHNGRSLDAPS